MEKDRLPEETEIGDDPEKDLAFPYEIISGVAGDFTDLYCQYIESPRQFAYMAFLNCLGSHLSPRLTMESALLPQPRLYVLLLGPSGSSRKSTIIKLATDFFTDAIITLAQQNFYVCRGIGSDIGLLRQLEISESVLLVLDEFKLLTSKSGITGSALLPCISTLFDGNKYENQTKMDGIVIPNAHLSILAASTPETYDATWNPEFTDIGLNNRIFIVPGEGQRLDGFPAEIPAQEIMAVQRRLGKILFLVGKSPKLEITTAAKDIYSEWYRDLENSRFSQRLEAYAHRFMPLLAVNDLKTEVDEEIVKKVIQLCNWQLEVRKLLIPVDADNEFARMEQNIRRVLEVRGPLTKRKIRQHTNADRKGIRLFGWALENLETAGIVEREKSGRTERYFLTESSS